MYNKNLTQVLRLTAEMENNAASGEWGVVQELNAARLIELEKLDSKSGGSVSERSEVLACLMQSNKAIESLAKETRSSLRLERHQLLQGRKATGSYEQIQRHA